MSHLDIFFDCNNAAFAEEQVNGECSRILQELALKIAGGAEDGPIADYNGNTVGNWNLVITKEGE